MSGELLKVLCERIRENEHVGIVVGSCAAGQSAFLSEAFFMVEKAKNIDMLVAADGGLDILLKVNITPHVVVGDRDSISDTTSDMTMSCEFVDYPTDKDYSDMQLAIETLLDRIGDKDTCVLIFGGTGGRLDHFLTNTSLMEYYARSRNVQLIIVDKQNILLFVGEKEEKIRFSMKQGLYFSILPVSEEIEELTIVGAKYGLDKYHARRGMSRLVSNCLNECDSERQVEISKKSGAFVLAITCDNYEL